MAGWKVHEGSEKDLPNIAFTAGVLPDAAKSILKSPRSHRVGRKYLAVLLELQSDASFKAFLRDHGVKSVSHGAGSRPCWLARNRHCSGVIFRWMLPGHPAQCRMHAWRRQLYQLAKAGFKLAESFQWGCVSFKYRKRGGLQVDCCRKSRARVKDDGARILCTYSGNCKSEEEWLALVRRMKYFVMQEGFNDDCNTYAAHQAVKRKVAKMPLADIPDSDALDRALCLQSTDLRQMTRISLLRRQPKSVPCPNLKPKARARLVGLEERMWQLSVPEAEVQVQPEAQHQPSLSLRLCVHPRSDPDSSSSSSSGSSHGNTSGNDDSSSSSGSSSSS